MTGTGFGVGLISRSFVGVLALVALALCSLVVWGWPRLAAPGGRRVAGRIAMLGVAQLALLATVFATANKYFGFYTTWDDLLGAGSKAYTITDRVLPASPVRTSAAFRQVPALPGRSPALGGAVEHITIHGETTGLAVPATVYLPPQYFQPAATHTDLPVAVVLAHGAGAPTPAMLTAAIVAHRLRPVVVVTVDPVLGGVACTDVPAGRQGETFLAQDLRAALVANLRVTSDPVGWGVAGTGVGGYCAVKLAMRDSGQYAAAAARLPGSRLAPPAAPASVYGGSAAIRSENDVRWLVRHMPPPPVSLLVEPESGTAASPVLAGFARQARPPLVVDAVAGGGCGSGVIGLLPWLADRLSVPPPGYAPGAPPPPLPATPLAGTTTAGMTTASAGCVPTTTDRTAR